MARAIRRRSAEQPVIDLRRERERRRVLGYRSLAQDLLDANRRALNTLFSTGTVFTRQGARAGRDLLAAHQNLLKVSALLGGILDEGSAGLSSRSVKLLCTELDTLLKRSRALASRGSNVLARMR